MALSRKLSDRLFVGLGGGAITGIIVAVIAAFYGWGCNIAILISSVSDHTYLANVGMFVLRVVGVFVFPLGVILGYF